MLEKTILITGSSSGIGKAAAQYFVKKGWNVAATMRNLDVEIGLKESSCLRLYRLDVQSTQSIKTSALKAISDFGRVDAVLNVNCFGMMAVTQQLLPHFRENRSGTVMNVCSGAGRLTMPLHGVYCGCKWAIEGFSETLAYELAKFGIRVKIIEPGYVKTHFNVRSGHTLEKQGLDAYDSLTINFDKTYSQFWKLACEPEVVATVIYKAASDGSDRMRYPVGRHAKTMLKLRELLATRLHL